MERDPVAIYVRVSSLEQAEHGWSIEGQIKEIREYCENKGYKPVRLYKDEGFSATNIERPSLQKMLEHSIDKKFEKLIIWKYDRLSRNDMDFFALIHFLQKNDIQIESINEPTPNDGSPYNEFIVGILGLVSSLERRVFRMRTRMGMKVRLEKGFYKGSHPPYGYDYNLETGHLEINEIESNAVKEIFGKYFELGTLNQVRNYCILKEFLTKRGAKWGLNTIRRILSNRVYLGDYIYNDIQTHHKDVQIIDNDLFDRVQGLLKERSKYRVKNREFRDIDKKSISYDYNGDDEDIQGFLLNKVEMPECPRCDNNLEVSKWGWHDSPTVGKLQQYYCKPCNHEFMIFPKEKVKKDKPYCPKCHNRINVRKEGHRQRKTLPPIQKYTCTKCNYWFEK